MLHLPPALQVTKKVAIQREENAEICLQHQYFPGNYFLVML